MRLNPLMILPRDDRCQDIQRTVRHVVDRSAAALHSVHDSRHSHVLIVTTRITEIRMLWTNTRWTHPVSMVLFTIQCVFTLCIQHS